MTIILQNNVNVIQLQNIFVRKDNITSDTMVTKMYKDRKIHVIELYMMDKRKYFPLTMLSGFTVRTLLYPFSLIKTRIQVQKQKSIYNGTFDAFKKIYTKEGYRGLYRGFWVSNLLIVPQLTYITTYEGTRHYLQHHTPLTDNRVRSFMAGGMASLVSQTFVVPIDIVSQHLMMAGLAKQGIKQKTGHVLAADIAKHSARHKLGTTIVVIKSVYKHGGLRGFYKGYLPSLCVYAPSSAMWWFFYDIYSGILSSVSPEWVPHLVLQCIAAPVGGMSTSFLTNPMDIIRARIQVENSTLRNTVRELWREEQLRIFTKGLSARLIQSITFSFFIILGYETIKRLSVLEEHKHKVRW